jgi:hypothetical protein
MDLAPKIYQPDLPGRNKTLVKKVHQHDLIGPSHPHIHRATIDHKKKK